MNPKALLDLSPSKRPALAVFKYRIALGFETLGKFVSADEFGKSASACRFEEFVQIRMRIRI